MDAALAIISEREIRDYVERPIAEQQLERILRASPPTATTSRESLPPRAACDP